MDKWINICFTSSLILFLHRTRRSCFCNLFDLIFHLWIGLILLDSTPPSLSSVGMLSNSNSPYSNPVFSRIRSFWFFIRRSADIRRLTVTLSVHADVWMCLLLCMWCSCVSVIRYLFGMLLTLFHFPFFFFFTLNHCYLLVPLVYCLSRFLLLCFHYVCTFSFANGHTYDKVFLFSWFFSLSMFTMIGFFQSSFSFNFWISHWTCLCFILSVIVVVVAVVVAIVACCCCWYLSYSSILAICFWICCTEGKMYSCTSVCVFMIYMYVSWCMWVWVWICVYFSFFLSLSFGSG